MPSNLFSESVFLKDGKIINGKISKKSGTDIIVVLNDGTVKQVTRNSVLRILYHENYKTKQYIHKKNGEYIFAHITGEDEAGFTIRYNLESPVEYVLARDEVISISREKPAGIVVTDYINDEQSESITSFASLISFSGGVCGPFESDMAESLGEVNYLAELNFFFYRMRNETGNGLDFFCKGSYRHFDSGGEFNEGNYLIMNNYKSQLDYYGIHNSSEKVFTLSNSQYSIGSGLRYIYGYEINGILWQLYVAGTYQFKWNSLRYGACDSAGANAVFRGYHDTASISHGLLAAAGIEVAPFKHAGFFIEMQYGLNLPGIQVSEGQMILCGVVFRTPFKDGLW